MTTATPERPRPGSDEAVALGCKCPVMDNRRGAGYRTGPDGRPEYVLRVDCPVHAPGGTR